MIKLFKYLQFLVVPFTLLAIWFIVKGSFIQADLDDVGFGVLCMGIGFGFSSMGDITNTSNSEEKLFSDKIKFRRRLKALTILGFAMMITTVFFLVQKNNEDVYQLGLNCFPLIIAIFFTLKQLLDKKQYFELTKQNA